MTRDDHRSPGRLAPPRPDHRWGLGASAVPNRRQVPDRRAGPSTEYWESPSQEEPYAAPDAHESYPFAGDEGCSPRVTAPLYPDERRAAARVYPASEQVADDPRIGDYGYAAASPAPASVGYYDQPIVSPRHAVYDPEPEADMLTMQERCGRLAGLRLAYVGDGNNVLNSLLSGAALAGMEIVAATPAGYAPSEAVITQARALASQTGAVIRVTQDPVEAVSGADVVYTDTWVSMGHEDEAATRRVRFAGYQVNEELVAKAAPGAGVMHCLPAHRGEEITDAVMDGPRSWVFDQAENRLHAQKAVLVDLLAR